jgi:pectate lyase
LVASATTIVLAALLVSRADAATLFSDDFNDGNASGWSTSGGSWSATSGTYRQSSTGADAKAQAGTTSWNNYTVQAMVTPTAFGNSTRSAGVVARAQSMTSFYSLVLVGSGSLQLRRISGGGVSTLASAAAAVTPGTTYTLALTVNGPSLSGSVNGTQLVAASDSTFAAGRVGLVASYTSVSFDNVAVFTGSAPPTPTSSPSPSASTSPPPPPPPGQADGFASVNALGQNGTTGGLDGPTATVTTAAALADYAGRPEPYNILISGTIGISSMITVVANKSIIGIGSTAHLTGGGAMLPGEDVGRPAAGVERLIRRVDVGDLGSGAVDKDNAQDGRPAKTTQQLQFPDQSSLRPWLVAAKRFPTPSELLQTSCDFEAGPLEPTPDARDESTSPAGPRPMSRWASAASGSARSRPRTWPTSSSPSRPRRA